MSRGRYHREKNMTSFFCLRIPFSVRARPVLTLESILINYSPIFFLCCYSRWLQLEYGAFLLVPSEERWAHTMNGFCSSRDQPWAELHRFRHTWILYVWLAGYETLGKSLQLSELQNSTVSNTHDKASFSECCDANWDKVCIHLVQTIWSTP